MTSPHTPVPHVLKPGQPLTAETVDLVKRGDLLSHPEGGVCRAFDSTRGWPVVDCLSDGAEAAWPAEEFTWLGRPDADGWIAHDGKSVPVREIRVDVKTVGTGQWGNWVSDQWGQSWLHEGDEADHITHWRPHVPPQSEGRDVPADVARLVVAARMVAFDEPTQEQLRALDIASEAFADRVPWDDQPEPTPSVSLSEGAGVEVSPEMLEAAITTYTEALDQRYGQRAAMDGAIRAAIHSMPRISDTDLANRVSEAKERLRPYLAPPPQEPEGGALREALEFYRDAWNSEPNGDPRIPGDASGFTTEPADELLADKGARARKVLSALPSLAQAQGERGGDIHHLLVEFANAVTGATLEKRIEYLKVFADRFAALSSPPAAGWRPERTDVEECIHAWLRDHAPLTIKMVFTPTIRDALADAILALPAQQEGGE